MKKTMQNVLAQNSNSQIAYLCGKCGKEVEKEALKCRHCGARLGKIVCPFCKFKGSIEDFKLDTCPRCGRKNDSTAPVKKKNENTGYKKMPLSKKMFWFLFMILTLGIIALILIIEYNFNLI
jgi:uncharacterized membrane protein YvbJ